MLAQWGDDEEWRNRMPECCNRVLDDEVTAHTNRKLLLAFGQPYIERCRRFQRELGFQILCSISPSSAVTSEPLCSQKRRSDDEVNLREVVRRLKAVKVDYVKAELVPLLEAVGLCIDHKPMLEIAANRDIAKQLLSAIDRVIGQLTARNISKLLGSDKDRAGTILLQMRAKMIIYVPGLEVEDEL